MTDKNKGMIVASNDNHTQQQMVVGSNVVITTGNTQTAIASTKVQSLFIGIGSTGTPNLKACNSNNKASSALSNFKKVKIGDKEYSEEQINCAIQAYNLQDIIAAVPPAQYKGEKNKNIRGTIIQLLKELKLSPTLKRIRKRPGAHPGKGIPSKAALIEYLYGFNPYETKKIESLSKRWVRRAIKYAVKNRCNATSLLVAKLKDENKKRHKEIIRFRKQDARNQAIANRISNTPTAKSGQLFDGAIVDFTQATNNTNIVTMSLPLANDALVFLAVIPDQLTIAMDAIKNWGLTYVDNVVWDRNQIKGQKVWSKNQHTNILIATKGNPAAPITDFRLESVHFDNQNQGQADLPDYYYDIMENLVPGGVFLEVFSKRCYDSQWSIF